jgi:RNA polymerase sigma-70 factor, ECF subfamily
MSTNLQIRLHALPPAEVRAAWDIESLFLELSPYVAQVARRLLRNADDVDDLVQDVFYKAMLHLDELRDPRAVKGWLRTSTVRACLKRLKRQRLWEIFSMDDFEPASMSVRPDDAALLSRAEAILAKVPVEARAAWILRHVEGERLDAIALILDRSLATTKRLITRAEEALDRSFADAR